MRNMRKSGTGNWKGPAAKCTGIVAFLLSAGLVSGCAQDTTSAKKIHEFPDGLSYGVNSQLLTTNAGTKLGAHSDAEVLNTRIYPGPFITGPDGQLIPNTDLVDSAPDPRNSSRVIFSINENAKYSDGEPVTCDAFLLAVTAGAMPEIFNSQLPLMRQVSTVDCAPGNKNVAINFIPGAGDRWRQLISPGVLMPAHAIAKKAGISLEELNARLQARDTEQLRAIADIWNTGFELAKYDPELQVSAGPYKIESIEDNGEVILGRNEFYAGAQALEPKIVLWPKGADLAALAADKKLGVAEVPSTSVGEWVHKQHGDITYSVTPMTGILTEQLVFNDAGIFADQSARQAFAGCVDRTKLAQISQKISGVEVSPVTVRTVRWDDPVVQRMGDIVAQHKTVPVEEVAPLEGTEISLGYAGPDPRLAAMVEEIAATCSQAGVIVRDSSADPLHTADVLLEAVDPQREFPSVLKLSSDTAAARASEIKSWEDMWTIPVATQPRVFVIDPDVPHIEPNTDLSGIGWNMDRWGIATQEKTE